MAEIFCWSLFLTPFSGPSASPTNSSFKRYSESHHFLPPHCYLPGLIITVPHLDYSKSFLTDEPFFHLCPPFLPPVYCQHNSQSNFIKNVRSYHAYVQIIQCFPFNSEYKSKSCHYLQDPVWSGPCKPCTSLISSSTLFIYFTLLQLCWHLREHHSLPRRKSQCVLAWANLVMSCSTEYTSVI